ncbi:hypothetical protein ACIPXV_09485 [Streptomyces libani]|uniref:hypothetical protein n=1 Tax=Streptomyces nigrescens TaxID=1920 RepID=UPI0038250325
MQLGLLIGLTRLRVALMIAGLAFFMGLTVPLGIRVLVLILIAVGIATDGAVEEERRKQADANASTPPRRYDTAA